jgi:hypothetical protein
MKIEPIAEPLPLLTGVDGPLRPASIHIEPASDAGDELAATSMQLTQDLLEAGRARLVVDDAGVRLQVDRTLPREVQDRVVMNRVNQRLARIGFGPRRAKR